MFHFIINKIKYSLIFPYLLALIIFYGITYNEFCILITGGDNQSYVAIGKTLSEGLTAATSPYEFRPNSHFLGYPLLLAPFFYFKNYFNPFILLPLLNIILGFLNCVLVDKIFGRKVAFFAIACSLALMQRIFLGGAEPFFMFFGLLSIYFYDRNIYLAIVFAALSFWVRSFGIFFIFGLLSTQYLSNGLSNKFFYTFFTAILCVAIYIYLSLWFHGSANIGSGYNNVWDSNTPFGIPFYHLVNAIFHEHRLFSLLKALAYIGLSLFPFYTIVKRSLREKSFSSIKVFDLIYIPYLIFIYQLNSFWAYIEFVRYTCPVFPIALFYFKKFLPESKVVSYIILVAAVSLSALSIKGSLLGF